AEAAAEFGDLRVNIELAAFDQRLARQREAVRVQAAALQPEQDVARTNRGTGEHPVERHGADRGPDEIEPAAGHHSADPLAKLCQLPARAAPPGELAAPGDPFPEGAEYLGRGFLDRDVVDERDGPCADAEHVVDVHRDAIDADGVVAPDGLR